MIRRQPIVAHAHMQTRNYTTGNAEIAFQAPLDTADIILKQTNNISIYPGSHFVWGHSEYAGCELISSREDSMIQ
jgi:hypothetical protein